MDRLQPRHELESQQPAECEGDRALAVGVHILTIDLHLGAMMDDPLDHGGDLGGGRGFKLGMNAQRVPLDMPVDHDAAAAIAHVPLRRQVLVPGAKVLGIRCAGRRSVAPDCRISGMQRAVGDDGNGLPQRVDRDISAPDIGKILGGCARLEPGHALKPGVRSEPVQAKQEPRAQNGAIQGLVSRRAFESLGKSQAEVGLLEYVEEVGHRPGRDNLCLDRCQVRRLGLGIERRHRDPTLFFPLPVDSDQRIARHAGVEGLKRLAHFGLEIGDEAIGIERQLQRLIIRCALRLEVGREILVRVAVPVGPDHPDLLAAQLVAQRLKDADLIGDPVDALTSLGILFDDRFSPEALHDAVERHRFLGGKGLEFRVGVTLQEIERLDDRAMMLVVRAEFQALKDVGRHAAVMTLVGIADHRPERGLVARPRGLRLFDQVTQGLFADDRKDDLAHGPIRFLESRAGKVEQEILLARDALQIIEQFPIHPAFGARPDAMNGLDQNIDEVIRQRPAAQMHEGREPSEPCRLRMPAELIRGLACNPPPIALELMRKHAVEQIGRQFDPANQLQFGQLILNAGQARLSRIPAQPQKQCRRRSRSSDRRPDCRALHPKPDAYHRESIAFRDRLGYRQDEEIANPEQCDKAGTATRIR